MGTQIAYLAGALVLILLNGFFVMAEFALVKVRATKLQELARAGNANAKLVLTIIGRLDAYLSACQLGITVASLALGWISEPALAKLLQRSSWVTHGLAVAIALTIMTVLHVVIGEQAPKMLAIRKAERAALFAATPLRWFYFLLFVPLTIVNGLSNLVLRILGIPPVGEAEMAHSEEELRIILGASHEKGQFTLARLLMMENVLDFGTLRVGDVMTDIDKVVALRADAPWAENHAIIRKALHSRYPLRKPGPDAFDSVIHIKDIALAIAEKFQPPDLPKIARPLRSIRSEATLEELLSHFEKTHTQMAVVVEGARQVGVATLEDVIEELIGTVRDEFEPVKQIALGDITRPEAVVLDLAGTKEEAIRRLAATLGCPAEGVAAILKREELASTGLEAGIAIPHARVPGIPKPCLSIGRSEGIDFKSLDGQPARLIFLLLTPHHDEGAHVHVLGRISALLSSEYLRQRIESAKTADEVIEILRISDRSLPA